MSKQHRRSDGPNMEPTALAAPAVPPDQILADFGQISQEILNQDVSRLRLLITGAISEVLAGNAQNLSSLAESFRQRLGEIFAAHPLFVLFEKTLNCDARTDHLAPKDVYPLYSEELKQFVDDVVKITRASVGEQLILAGEQISSAARLALVETAEINEFLLLRLVLSEQESQKFKDLFDTNVTKFVDREQGLKRYVQLLREQIHEKKILGAAYQADFINEKSAALDYRENVVLSTERLRGLQARNTQLEKEVVRLTGELEGQKGADDRLQEYANLVRSLENELNAAREQVCQFTAQHTRELEEIHELQAEREQIAQRTRFYEGRIEMYRDDPEEVATGTLQPLSDAELEAKFSLKPEYSEHDVLTEMRMYDIEDLQDMAAMAAEFESQLVRLGAKESSEIKRPEKSVQANRNISGTSGSEMSANESQITAFEKQADADRAEIERLNQQLVDYIRMLEGEDRSDAYSKAINAGLRSLEIRDVECQTDIDEVGVVDHAERLQQFVHENQSFEEDIKQTGDSKRPEKKQKPKIKEEVSEQTVSAVESGYTLVLLHSETGELHDLKYNSMHLFCKAEEEMNKQQITASLSGVIPESAISKQCVDKTERAANQETVFSSNKADERKKPSAKEVVTEKERCSDDEEVIKPATLEHMDSFAQTEAFDVFAVKLSVETAKQLMNLFIGLSEAEETRFLEILRTNGLIEQVAGETDGEKPEICLPSSASVSESAASEKRERRKYSPNDLEELMKSQEIEQPSHSKGQIFSFNDAELLKEQGMSDLDEQLNPLLGENIAAVAVGEELEGEEITISNTEHGAELGQSQSMISANDAIESDEVVDEQHLEADELKSGAQRYSLTILHRPSSVKQLHFDPEDHATGELYAKAANRFLPDDMRIEEAGTVFDAFKNLQKNVQRGEERKEKLIAEIKRMQELYWTKVGQAYGFQGKESATDELRQEDLIPIKLRTFSVKRVSDEGVATTTSQAIRLPQEYSLKRGRMNNGFGESKTEPQNDPKPYKNQLLSVKALVDDMQLSKSAILPNTQLSAARGMVGRSLSQRK